MPAAQKTPELRGVPSDLQFDFIGEGAAGAFTLTGITTRDKILKVLKCALALTEGVPNTLAFTTSDVTSTFSITAANTVNSGATSLVDSFALVVWYKNPKGH